MIDLFGAEITEEKAHFSDLNASKGKRDYTPKGYSAPPGTGPKGEVCKGCKHFVRLGYHDKTYFKCLLSAKLIPDPRSTNPRTRHSLRWSHCHTSDIRANSPACRNWTMPEVVEWVSEELPR